MNKSSQTGSLLCIYTPHLNPRMQVLLVGVVSGPSSVYLGTVRSNAMCLWDWSVDTRGGGRQICMGKGCFGKREREREIPFLQCSQAWIYPLGKLDAQNERLEAVPKRSVVTGDALPFSRRCFLVLGFFQLPTRLPCLYAVPV